MVKKIKDKRTTRVPIKKKIKKYRCIIRYQHLDFNSQEEARKMLLDVLNTGRIYYCSLEEIEVEE